VKAYKFLKDNMESGSGNEPAWKVGEERTFAGTIKLCESGYHSSPSFYDALQYARGNIACIVEVSKPVEKQGDKQVSKTLKIVTAYNAEKVLRNWACDCAERALKKAKVTDEKSWNAIKVARLYNAGEATVNELAAARSAAEDARAAWAAAWAAEAAARAAWAAAEDARAAWAAAEDARAAWAAAWAAEAAEIKWQKRHLDKLMEELFVEVLNEQ